MKELIKELLRKWSCYHDWEFITEVEVHNNFGGYHHIFHFVCKKCGKFKKVKSI